MFSALVVMICCAVPAFADDSDSVFTEHIFSQLENTYPHSEYSYMVISYKPSNSPFTFFQCFVVSQSSKIFYNSSDRTVSTDGTFIDSFVHRFSGNSCGREVSYGNIVYVDIKDFNIIYSDLPVYDGDSPIYTDPNAVPAPFTVTYTPELSLNMQNKIYYPSKGGANADENGLVAAENNNINLDIKLTPEFLKTFNEKDLGKAYGSGTYAVLCCLSKNLLNADDDLQRFFDEDVVLYAMNHDGNYYKGQDDEKVKSDGSISDDLNSNGTVDTFEPYLTLYQGRTPIYTIPRDGKITVSFDLTSIDYKTHGLTDDSQLYVNVIGVFVKNNGQVSVKNDEHEDNTNNSTWLGSYAYQEDFTNLKTCEKIDDFVKSVDEETGKPETFKAYRVYSVISDPFSYEKFPDYVPKVYKDKDGNTYNPSTTKLKDLCNIPPSKVTDVDLAKGSDGVIKDGSYMQPDDYDDYLKNKKMNLNFSDVDYTDLGTLFAVTGNYFKFLTCSLSILPDWFITIFTTWFILMLGIAIFKLAIGLSSAIPKG